MKIEKIDFDEINKVIMKGKYIPEVEKTKDTGTVDLNKTEKERKDLLLQNTI
ncbi:MAG: hypothetical protein KAI67_02300 [Candidatus Pacebacteria bacterium]|nr:hypothetical protein [Candidatus Paceibacterota bacterium]